MATSTLPDSPPEEKNNPGQDEFDKLIDRNFSPGDERMMEERAKDGALDDNGGTPSRKDLSRIEKNPSGGAARHPQQVGRGYTGDGGGPVGLRQALQNKRRNLIIGGGVVIASAVFGLALFGLFGAFKLDGLMSNIEDRAFVRNNAALDARSTKYITAYLEARMLQVGDNPNDNLLFRAERVDNNKPFTDWYRTLRASNFEQEVFEKNGIKFTSMVGADGKIRPGVININGQKSEIPIGNLKDSDITAIQNGDIKTLNRYADYFETTPFGSNKEARAAIKKVVNDNTYFFQVYKRRSIRKAIQNMTGVRDWRFFETTRDKISAKKIDLRNRVLDSILPDPNNNVVTDVVRCFYGLNKCNPNRDPANKTNRPGEENAEEANSEGTQNTEPDNTNAEAPAEQKLPGDTSIDAAGISDALKKILAAANVYTKIVNIPSTLDMLTYVNKNISNLVKLVAVARGAQAAGLFQVFETANDQIKTGQVSGQEVNALMENLENASSSAGWTKVVDGDGDPSTTQSGGVCSQSAQALQEENPQQFAQQYAKDNPDYAPLCADQQIGSATNAQKIQEIYKNSIGQVIGPIANVWGGLKGNIITGTLINVVSWLGNLTNKLTSSIANTVLSIVGLKGDIHSAIAWVFAKTSNFLGVTILKGYESGGTIFNWMMQGGAYTAESASRDEGAALTTDASKATAQNVVGLYQQDKTEDTSLYDRVASLNNPDSLAFKGAFALSNFGSDPTGSVFGSLHNMVSDLGKNFGLLFGKNAYAATPSGYAASQFAGIETYDFPQQCYDLDPLTAQPIDGTNALDVFANPSKYGINHAPFPVSQTDMNALNSWSTETDSDSFFDTVYDVIGQDTPNADDVAVHIYNCNLLDSAVRGSLGYVYGYTDNNGIN